MMHRIRKVRLRNSLFRWLLRICKAELNSLVTVLGFQLAPKNNQFNSFEYVRIVCRLYLKAHGAHADLVTGFIVAAAAAAATTCSRPGSMPVAHFASNGAELLVYLPHSHNLVFSGWRLLPKCKHRYGRYYHPHFLTRDHQRVVGFESHENRVGYGNVPTLKHLHDR
ncbi:hypothetical protein BKA58DRAFT_99753 [Alternaria rosae]|uniref:uncharacterized protein n=1 Tax=Alternaria rosae TaxID=1187941 RepID=UPI001E8EEFF4|nr:uncharacterized protein BKA58DRAFT_99753 [Alternaria rosae]KAH6878658.1 hypothetical protein BKA58DRAFT_99753 [Alternaria rosae]